MSSIPSNPVQGLKFTIAPALVSTDTIMEPTMLETRLFLPDGRSEAVALKVWPSGDMLKWELRRLLPAAGYRERSHRTKTGCVVSQQWDKWCARLTWHGFDISTCLHRSLSSVQMRASRAASSSSHDNLTTEPEYAVDTRALFALLAFWAETRRDSRDRTHCKLLAECLLSTCIPDGGPWLQRLTSVLDSPSAEHLALCNIAVNDGVCFCFSNAHGEAKQLIADAGEGAPHSTAWSLLGFLLIGSTTLTF